MPEETTTEREWVHYEPEVATLVSKTRFNEIDTVFEFELEDRDELGHMPGQFVQVFVPGAGEAPFSVSSSPTKDGPFELCIRKVGKVTTAIHEMEIGDTLGIRGPFGETCEIETFKGNDMLFVAGGIGLAPLRSMINFSLDHRDWFRDITVVYGCKDPTEILFPEEIERWQERDDIRFDITVDEVPEGVEWDDHVGVITTLLPGLKIDAPNTYTIVCGPPVMFQYVQDELDAKEIPHDHIYLSLERRMHCGVGLCGHCQINDLYVCQDGPVFNYEVIKDRPEALS